MPYKSISAVVASSNNVSTPLTLTPVLPARANGDLLIAITTSRSNTAAVATPAGWTLWPGFPKRSATVSGGTIYVFYKEVVGGEANPGLVWSNLTTGTTGDSCQAIVMCLDRVEVTSPSDVTPPAATDASSANPSIPTLTTVGADAEVIGISLKVSDTGQTGTIANSFTERGDFHTTTGTGHHLYIATRTMATPGATGASVVTESNGTAARCLAVALAVKERIPVTYFGAVSKQFTFGATVSGIISIPLPPFPTVSVVDNFNGRTESPPAAPWAGSWAVDGFRVMADILFNPSGLWDGIYWDVPVTSDDQECFVTISQFSPILNTTHMQLHIRRNPAADTGYILDITPIGTNLYGWSLYRRISGSDQLLKSQAVGMDPGDSVGISAIGNEIYVWYKPVGLSWGVVFSSTDTNIPFGGVAAIYSNDSVWHFDDWGASPAAPVGYSAEVLDDNPLAYWRLGESSGLTANDLSGNGHHGTYIGSPALGQVGPLADGNTAVAFDAVDDAVAIPNSLTLPAGSSITVEFWAHYATVDLANRVAFALHSVEPSRATVILWSDGVLYWDYESVAQAGRLTTPYADYRDKFTLIHLTFDAASGKHAISLNGVEVASTITAAAPSVPLVGGRIGRFFDGAPDPYWFKGMIDEFAVYDYALSPARRFAHYQARLGTAGETHYGATSMELNFARSVQGIRKTFGQVALPITFNKDIRGLRKTFGQLLSPFIFGKAVAGRKTTFGQVALSLSIGIATAGFRAGLTLYGALSLPVIFVKDVRGQRKAFGQMAMPLTFTKDVRGQRKTFGQITLPIIFTKEAVGRKNVFGQLSMQTLFGKEVAGRRKTFSQLVMPTTFSKAVSGRKQTFGRVAFPINVLVFVDGQSFIGPKTLYGQLAMPLTFNKQISARRKTFGQVTAPFIFGKVLQGRRKTFSKVELPLDFETIVKSGLVGVHGAVEFELILTMDTNGILRPTAIVLNNAAGVYLGTIPVQAVYVGGQKVWQLVNV